MPSDEPREIVVRLSITRDQFLKVYQGTASQILAMAENGQRVQFPARALRPFVNHDGINGQFALRIDANNNLIDLTKNPAN